MGDGVEILRFNVQKELFIMFTDNNWVVGK